MLDIAIEGGKVVTAHAVYPADIGIEGDKIALVAAPGSLPPARHEIDADGCSSCRAPSTSTSTCARPLIRSAAPFSRNPGGRGRRRHHRAGDADQRPCCATVEVFESRKALGEAESLVNFGLYGAPGLLNRDEILGMADAGACGFKIFTHGIQPGREDEFEGLCLEDESDLYRVLELVKETGRMVSFHAENERLIQLFGERIRRTGRVDPAAFVESRRLWSRPWPWPSWPCSAVNSIPMCILPTSPRPWRLRCSRARKMPVCP